MERRARNKARAIAIGIVNKIIAGNQMSGELIHLGPIAYRQFSLELTCDEDVGHSHNFDHITFVNVGSVRVFFGDGITENDGKIYIAGEFFLCRADVHHRIKAMEPDTHYTCMFSHRDADGIVTQQYSSEAAYH